MPTVVLNNANAHHLESLETDRLLIEALQAFFKSENLEVDIAYSHSFPELEKILQERSDVAVVFTNCPPDSTYQKDTKGSIREAYGEIVLATPADSYEKSKDAIKSLCNRYAHTPVIIITGAPRHILTHGELMGLSATQQVIVKRKDELLAAPQGFEQAYADYAAREASRCLKMFPTERIDAWRRIQTCGFKFPQFGGIRVLLLSRDRALRQQMSRALTECFDAVEPVFSFTVSGTIAEARDTLSNLPLEMVLAVYDEGYWLSLLPELSIQQVPFGMICIVPTDDESLKLPPGVTPFRLDKTRSFSVRELASMMIRCAESGRAKLRIGSSLLSFQTRFLDALEDEGNDKDSTYRALRSLCVNHSEFVNAIADQREDVKLFLPVGSLQEMRALLRRSLFVADKTLFTFLPPIEMKLIEGTNVSLMQLWDVAGAPLASMVEVGLRDLVLEHRSFFADGRILFYPSPCLVRVNESNVDVVMPEAKHILKERPDFPIWRQNRAFSYYLSASSIGGYHVVLPEHKPIAELGKVLAEIPIPFIDNVPADVLESIIRDNAESLASFRHRVQATIEDYLDSGSDPEREWTRRNFARNLEDGTKELEDRLSLLRKSTALQSMGAAFMTTLATLSAVSLLDIPSTVSVLIGSGGLGTMGIQYLQYLQELKHIKKSPFYIIWRISRQGSRA